MKKITRVYDSCDFSRELSCTWFEGILPVCRVYATFSNTSVLSFCVSVLRPFLCPATRISYFVSDFVTPLYKFMNCCVSLDQLNSDSSDGGLL